MQRLVLMVDDVNLFTGIHHQCQTIILKKIDVNKRVIYVFVKMKHRILQVCR